LDPRLAFFELLIELIAIHADFIIVLQHTSAYFSIHSSLTMILEIVASNKDSQDARGKGKHET
jgi:hypothetical protein